MLSSSRTTWTDQTCHKLRVSLSVDYWLQLVSASLAELRRVKHWESARLRSEVNALSCPSSSLDHMPIGLSEVGHLLELGEILVLVE